MFYREIEPSGAARSFIKCFWILEDPSPSSEPQRIFPDGRSELIFNLAEPFESKSVKGWQRQPQAFVVGQITGPMVIRSGGPAKILGVRFRSHGASRMLRAPASELTDSVVSLADISSNLQLVSDRLHECCTADQRLCVVENAAQELATKNARVHDAAIAFAAGEFERTNGQASIPNVARQLGISVRQLQRRFLAAVGVTPKLFCRMQRFQRVVRALDDAVPNWTDAAVGAGYYDQAHLIRDFRQFTGKAPTFLTQSELNLNSLFA